MQQKKQLKKQKRWNFSPQSNESPDYQDIKLEGKNVLVLN